MSKLAHVQAALQPSEPDPLAQQIDALSRQQSESLAKLARALIGQFQDLSERLSALENRKPADFSASVAALRTDLASVRKAVEKIEFPEFPTIPDFPNIPVPNLAPVLEAIARIKLPKVADLPLREYYVKADYDQWGDISGATIVQVK